jgi:hypothetical protein
MRIAQDEVPLSSIILGYPKENRMDTVGNGWGTVGDTRG